MPAPRCIERMSGVFLARDAQLTGERRLDPNEVIDVMTVPRTQIENLISSGAISHTLVISAFYLLNAHLGSLDQGSQ